MSRVSQRGRRGGGAIIHGPSSGATGCRAHHRLDANCTFQCNGNYVCTKILATYTEVPSNIAQKAVDVRFSRCEGGRLHCEPRDAVGGV